MSSKNKMLILGLCSTSDDRPSDLSNESQPKSKKMKKGPQCHWKIKCLFLDSIQLLMIGQVIKATKVDWNAKKKKKTLSHQEMECSVLDYVQLLMIGRVIWMTNVDQNTKKWKKTPISMKNKMFVYGWRSTFDDQLSDQSNKHWLKCNKNKQTKGPLCHQKIKCSFLDYVQLLMISQVIWVTNVDQNAKKMKKGPLCHWKIRCLLLDYVQLLMIGRVIWASNIDWKAKKNERRPPMSLKNKMLSFGLHSTSDDQPCNPSNKSQLKCWKRPLSDWKMKYSLLYYIQLLMIGQAIQVMKVYQNVKKWHVSVMVFCCFSLGLLYAFPLPLDGKVEIRVTEKFKFFRFTFNKFQPKDNSVQSLLHLLAMQLIYDGQWTNWFTLHFYNL